MCASRTSISATTLLTVLAGALFLAPLSVRGAEDLNCMHRAIDDRARELRDSYERYANDMNDVINRLSDDEHDAVDVDDAMYRQNDTARALYNFSYQMNEAWRRLSQNLQYAWESYYRKRNQCGFSGVAPAGYGGGYQQYNPYSYGYPRYPYNGVQVQCTQPVLAAPPAGCGYECAPDANGCQRCHLACRTPVTYSGCGCTPQYDPVCTRDGRTYDNACIAVCSGREVWYDGACR